MPNKVFRGAPMLWIWIVLAFSGNCFAWEQNDLENIKSALAKPYTERRSSRPDKIKLTDNYFIVLGEKATEPEQAAAVDLADFINACFVKEDGGEYTVPILKEKESAREKGRAVIIGLKENTALIPAKVSDALSGKKPDSYLIKAGKDAIYIVGTNPRSVLYAVYRLEELWQEDKDRINTINETREPIFNTRMRHTEQVEEAGYKDPAVVYTDAVFYYLTRVGINSYATCFISDDLLTGLEFAARSNIFPDLMPEQRKQCEKDLLNRLKLCERYGLDFYLTILSPFGTNFRARTIAETGRKEMDAFYKSHKELFGAKHAEGTWQGYDVLCISNPKVMEYYRDAMKNVLSDHPRIKGLIFWAGDCNPGFCEDNCDRCKATGKTRNKRYADFVNELYRTAKSVRSDIKVYVRSWGFDWKNGGLDAGIDVSATHSAGIVGTFMGKSFNNHTAGQPWINISEIGPDFLKELAIAKKDNRSVLDYCELYQSEATDCAYYLPLPMRVYHTLKNIHELGVIDYNDMWGVYYPLFMGANERVINEIIWNGFGNEEEMFARAAKRLYGEEGYQAGLEIWNLVDKAITHWAIVSFTQRFDDAIGRHGYGCPLYPPITLAGLKPASEYPGIWDQMRFVGLDNMARNNFEVADILKEAVNKSDELIKKVRPQYRNNVGFQREHIELARAFFASCGNTIRAVDLYRKYQKTNSNEEIAKLVSGIKEVAKAEIPNRSAAIAVARKLNYGPLTYDINVQLGEIHEMEKFIAGEKDMFVEWDIIGPFPTDKEDTGFDKAYWPEEKEEGAEKPIPVKAVLGKLVDLRALFSPTDPAGADYKAAYARIYIKSRGERKVKLYIGSDDGLKAWVNRSLVISNKITRGAMPGQEVAAVILNKGWNKILIKITNLVGGWGFYFDLGPDKRELRSLDALEYARELKPGDS